MEAMPLLLAPRVKVAVRVRSEPVMVERVPPASRHRQLFKFDVTQLVIQWPRAVFACLDG
jgi:hypothetical protein